MVYGLGEDLSIKFQPPLSSHGLCVCPSKRQAVVPHLEVELMDEGDKSVVELITGVDLVERASLRGLAGYDAARSTLTYANQSLVTSSTIQIYVGSDLMYSTS
jgi:hypothetical protein